MSTLSAHILTYVTLLLMHDDVNGLQITGLRLGNGGDREGSGGGPGPASISSSTLVNIPLSTSSPFPGHSTLPSTSSLPTSPPSTSSPSPSHIPSTSHISTLPSTSSLPTSTSPPSTSSPSLSHISSTGQNTLPSTSSLPTPTSNSGALLANSRHVAIVGAVLGSVVLAGLMALAYYRRRAGKARKQPKCSGYFSGTQTEMSQTQNGPPLTSSAPLLHRPVPLHFFDASSRDNTLSSLLPLIPADNSHDTTSHPPLSTSEFDSIFDVPSDPLQCPYDTQPFLSLDIARPEAENASTSTSDRLLHVHHVTAGFQDGLEANHKGDISDQSDPPPKYIGY